MSALKNLKLVDKVKENSLLRGVALSVYEIICRKPGLTVGEISIEYSDVPDPTALGRSRNELAKRVSDLVNWGAIKADGKTVCPYTGRQVNRYVPTGYMPERESTVKPLLQRPTASSLMIGHIHTPQASNGEFMKAPSTFEGHPRIHNVAVVSQNNNLVLVSLRDKAYKVQFLWWVPKKMKVLANQVVTALNEILNQK